MVELEKIPFVNNEEPDLSAETLNEMQDNIEDAIQEVETNATNSIEALQEENEYLNSLVEQAFDKKEVEGEELSIDDTINAKMEIELKGNTKQETTTGKNKCQIKEQSLNGITSQIINGKLKITGTATSSFTLRIMGETTLNGTYTFSCNGNKNSSVWFWNKTTSATDITLFNSNETKTYSTDNELIGAMSITNGQTYNELLEIMIEPGSTASSYEKYTGGVASPNPDYPQEVHKVTGDNTIVVNGKQLFDETYPNINANLSYKAIYVGEGNFTLKSNTPLNTNNNANLFFLAGNVTSGASTNTNGVYAGTKRTQDSVNGYITIAYRNIDNVSPVDYRTILYKTSQEQTFQINLGTIELCKIGDYQDYLYKSNNKWYLHKQIGKVVLDGNITGSIRSDIQNENTICFRTDAGVTNILSNSKPISNYFTAINDTSDVEHIRYIGTSGYRFQLFLSKQKATTANEVITWLSTHNTLIYYVLATPTDTEITDTTLIEQLEALKSAMSYAGQTNISQINNDAPFILQVTALASYNSRILALENAILNANRSTPVENTRKINEIIEEPKEEVTEKEEVVEPKEENKEEK